MYTIKVNFEDPGLKPVTLNNIEEGQSILEVCLNHSIKLHHTCGGVCTCSTCHIYINKGNRFLEKLSDKEKDFIHRAISPRLNSRLSCQCLLSEGSGVIEVLVPGQTRPLGTETASPQVEQLQFHNV
ncbi:MAG: (2Fe-2S)-binding protein [Bacteroidota bacterium]|nr:(2Fe-2S)-binding protein [Bacteroidota bacterium]